MSDLYVLIPREEAADVLHALGYEDDRTALAGNLRSYNVGMGSERPGRTQAEIPVSDECGEQLPLREKDPVRLVQHVGKFLFPVVVEDVPGDDGVEGAVVEGDRVLHRAEVGGEPQLSKAITRNPGCFRGDLDPRTLEARSKQEDEIVSGAEPEIQDITVHFGIQAPMNESYQIAPCASSKRRPKAMGSMAARLEVSSASWFSRKILSTMIGWAPRTNINAGWLNPRPNR